MLQKGLFDAHEWAALEADVDCAFGLVARARDRSFYFHTGQGRGMIAMRVHVAVRWGKLVGHAFVRWAILSQGGGDAAMAEAEPEAEEPFLEDETWEEPEAVAGS